MREVFVDESSQSGHQFMVLGALVVPGKSTSECEAAVMAVLDLHHTFGEMKWTKVSRAKLNVYRDLIACHFNLVREHGVEFHALILDCHQLDHRGYNHGDPELGFNKFLNKLLHVRVGRRFGSNERIVVHMDSRNSNHLPGELERFLNIAAQRDYVEPHRFPFARVAYRDSKNSRLIQLCDLLAGAVAWHKNDHDARDGASPAKTDLANYVANQIGRRRLGADVPKGQYALSVWNFRLGERGRGAR
jgi:hypothetical protein